MRIEHHVTPIQLLATLFLSWALSGCGGGGSNHADDKQQVAPVPPVVVAPPAGTVPPTVVAVTPVLPSGPPAGAACPSTNSIVATAGGTQLAIGASRSSGVAPLAVFFDATGTIASSTSRPFHDLEYRWNFGEAGSGAWRFGAKADTASRNEAMGPVAAHVFEGAGIFPITVSAKNGTTTVSYSCNITVLEAEAEFAGSKTVCVSNSGNFTGCPSGAIQVSSANATTAVASNIGAGNKRILFRRGETFNLPSTICINRPGPSMIGAYGSGAKPVIASSINATNSGMFRLSTSSTPIEVSDWRFQDLTIEGISGSTGIVNASTAFYGDGSFSRVLLHRVDMRNVFYGVNLSEAVINSHNGAAPFRHAMWDEFYVVDSSIFNLTPGNGPNSIFASAMRAAVLGTSIDNNGGGEHGIRFQLLNRGVLSHNTVRNTAVGKTNMTIRGTNWAGNNVMPPGTYSEKNVVSENKFVGGLGIGPQNEASDERGRNMIVERNWWHLGATLSTASSSNQSDVTYRNNVLYVPGNNGGSAFGAKPESVTRANIPTRVNVYNNTVYHSGSAADYGLFMATSNNGSLLQGSVFEVKNNIIYAPYITRGFIAQNNPGGSVATIIQTNNSSSTNTNPLLSAYPPLTLINFTPMINSYADGGGTTLPIYTDALGQSVQSSPDIGAISR